MLRSALFTTLLAFSATAGAQGFDYNFVSVGYTQLEVEFGSIDVDGDALGIAGSFEVNDSFFIAGNYNFGELEEQGIEVDVDTLSLGAGWHTPLSEQMDFFTTLSYEYVELSALGQSEDDSGIGLGAGLRFQASEAIELNAVINHVDLDESGSDTGFGLAMLYGVTDSLDIGITGDWGDDSSAYGINGRLYFGR